MSNFDVGRDVPTQGERETIGTTVDDIQCVCVCIELRTRFFFSTDHWSKIMILKLTADILVNDLTFSLRGALLC